MKKYGMVACLYKAVVACFDEGFVACLDEGVVVCLDENNKGGFGLDITHRLVVCFGFFSLHTS